MDLSNIENRISAYKSSLYFDADWYIANYSDVQSSGREAAEHFALYGEAEGRKPNPYFSAELIYRRFESSKLKSAFEFIVENEINGVDLRPLFYQGDFHPNRSNKFEGWILNPQNKKTSVQIIITVDKETIFHLNANNPRADLKEAGLGNCGFEFILPHKFCDGNIHSIGIVDAETGLHLLSSPYNRLVPDISVVTDKINKFNISGMGERPIISVVIPTFNRSGILSETINSIIKVIDREEIEIVVVDDGSTDQTPDILARAAHIDKRLRYTRVANSGPGAARNVGATEALGEYILFMGDDTRPTGTEFFKSHIKGHLKHGSHNIGVLGKALWPDNKLDGPNFIMSLIQGVGQQQFGYHYMEPWTFYNWSLFYTSNVSVKRSIVSDWETNGFSHDFFMYGFEDGEFAYRLFKNDNSFQVLYVPTAVVEHFHPYSVESFLKRQANCGMMMDVFIKKHPELRSTLLGENLSRAIDGNINSGPDLKLLEHYYALIEGIKSYAIILDKTSLLGSQNWHNDFFSAVFKLAMYDSYLTTQISPNNNQIEPYKFLMNQFQSDIKRAVTTELLGSSNLLLPF